jgi:hypothetical protein
MPVHVNELTTEIVAEGGDAAGDHGGGPGDRPAARWREVDRLRAAAARLEADEARTRAEGFHA